MVRNIWRKYKWLLIGILILVYMAVFIILDALTLPAHAAMPGKLKEIESLIRERQGRPEGFISIIMDLPEGSLQISIGTLPKNIQPVLIVDHEIRIHEMQNTVHEFMNASIATPHLVANIPGLYVDLGMDGNVDIVQEEIPDGFPAIVETRSEENFHQREFDEMIDAIFLYLTNGVSS